MTERYAAAEAATDTRRRGLTTFHLKLIAVVTMLIDHIGAVFSMRIPADIYLLMRCIGRLAFPIFCFLLVEGFHYTKSRWKYAGRLAVFCLISEPCYNLAFHNAVWYRDSQNVFWTLLVGFLMIMLLERLWKIVSDNKKRTGSAVRKLLCILCIVLTVAFVAAACTVTYLLKTDYSYKGILMIAAFYLLRKWKPAALTAFSLIDLFGFTRLSNTVMMIKSQMPLTFTYNFYVQDVGVLAIFPILLYNGRKGRGMKWFFYLFYPVHLFVLYLISLYFNYAGIV